MDAYAAALVRKIVEAASYDTRDSYAYARGMREALEMYLGADEARRVLFAAGHEY